MKTRRSSQHRLGVLYALVAYGIWGVLPLYLHAVRAVPPLQIVAHRIVWSFALLALVLALGPGFAWLERLRQRPRVVWMFVASATSLTINWTVFIWAASVGRVIDGSLGYFINPLFSVLLGVLVLEERLRPLQWAAVALAGLGVLWLTILAGQVPWIGLTLAASFAGYGLIRKTAALDALTGLAFETALLFPVAAAYLGWLAWHGANAWGPATLEARALLVAAGPVTAVPLLSFAAGARRIPLSLAGLLQYVGPTLQLLLGVFVFHEPFAPLKLFGFALIWLALVLYSAQELLGRDRGARAAP